MQLIRIGTRESKLALWQAKRIESLLNGRNIPTQIVAVKSEGDIDLVSPLYEMGVQGIFTRTLDAALLNNKIDVAVHSFKDVPVTLARGLQVAAIPERGSWHDVMVTKNASTVPFIYQPFTLATSSMRRKAQWLNRYPAHSIEPLRGNINTRLTKLKETAHWSAALFAAAGIERIGLEVPHKTHLDWMLPAPAQGAIVVVSHEDNVKIKELCLSFHDADAEMCTTVERSFLHTLQGGCSMPVGAHAQIVDDKILFRGNILSIDGKAKAEVNFECPQHEYGEAGNKAAEILLSKGGDKIITGLKAYQVTNGN